MSCQILQLVLTSNTAAVKTTTTTPDKPTSILSRTSRTNALAAHSNGTFIISLGLSDRTQSRTSRSSDAEQKSHARATAPQREPRRRATSFISTRSAQQRDHAAEKWFTDVRKLDINNVDQSDDFKPLPRKKRTGYESLKQHEMRPRTDLNALFAASTLRSATSLRLQNKRELGGDYTSYLPDGYADPYRLPVNYARLIVGRNRHVPLDAQTGALRIVEEAVRGRITKQGKYVSTMLLYLALTC